MKKEKSKELLGLFEDEIEKAPALEEKLRFGLKRLEKPFKESGEWKEDYQRLSGIEKNLEDILEPLGDFALIPQGIEDCAIILRKHIEAAKEALMDNRRVPEKELRGIDLNKRNLAARVDEYIGGLEEKKKDQISQIGNLLEENQKLREKIAALEEELRLERKK